MKQSTASESCHKPSFSIANITLFAQVIRLIPREIIQRLVKKHGTDKHAKGFNSWSHLENMIFSQFSGSVSLRQISEGLQSATDNLNHLGLSRAPSKSNISYPPPWCLSNLTASLRLNTFTKINLFQWINEPFSPPPDEPEIAWGDTPVFTANVKGRLTRLTAILHPSLAKNV